MKNPNTNHHKNYNNFKKNVNHYPNKYSLLFYSPIIQYIHKNNIINITKAYSLRCSYKKFNNCFFFFVETNCFSKMITFLEYTKIQHWNKFFYGLLCNKQLILSSLIKQFIYLLNKPTKISVTKNNFSIIIQVKKTIIKNLYNTINFQFDLFSHLLK